MIIENKTFSKINTRLVIILIVLWTILVYANALNNSFVWDDSVVIVDNNFIKSWGNLRNIFNRSYLTRFSDIDYLGIRDIGSGESSYRPIVTISYFFDYYFWKLNPFGYHFTNLLLHIFNVVLLYFLTYLVVKNRNMAMLTSLFFALHPVNSEAVCVISFREDLLVFLFFISAFIFYIKIDEYTNRQKPLFYIISVLLFSLALFSKEMAIIFPVVLVLYDYLFKKMHKDILSHFKSHYSGYMVILLFYLLIRFFLMNNIDKPRLAYPMANLYTNLLTMPRVFATYIQWMVFPINVHPTLPDDPTLISYSIFEPKVIVSVLLIAILLGIAIRIRKKSTLLSFGMLWFFVTIIPIANILFPLTNYIASRYLYLPIIGFCLLIATLLFELPKFKIFYISPVVLQKVTKNTVIVLLIFYTMFTIIRNMGWKNNEVFWLEMVERYPNNALAHSSLGASYRKGGALDKAIDEYKIAINLDPTYAKDYNSLGICYYEKGMLNESIAEFKKALKLDPNLLDAYNNLGSVLGDKGLYNEAINCLNVAIKIDSKYMQAYSNLGVTYARMQKWEEARKAWEKALEINPGYKEAQDNLKKLRELGH